MLLSKQVAVYINLVHFKLKQYASEQLRTHGIDITPEQFLLIDLLWNEGPMSQQKMADLMQKDKNSIKKIVDGLEKKGLVLRNRNTSDKRSNTLVLSKEAEEMKVGAKEFGLSILDDVLKDIPENEVQTFVDVLQKMNKNMSDKG